MAGCGRCGWLGRSAVASGMLSLVSGCGVSVARHARPVGGRQRRVSCRRPSPGWWRGGAGEPLPTEAIAIVGPPLRGPAGDPSRPMADGRGDDGRRFELDRRQSEPRWRRRSIAATATAWSGKCWSRAMKGWRAARARRPVSWRRVIGSRGRQRSARSCCAQGWRRDWRRSGSGRRRPGPRCGRGPPRAGGCRPAWRASCRRAAGRAAGDAGRGPGIACGQPGPTRPDGRGADARRGPALGAGADGRRPALAMQAGQAPCGAQDGLHPEVDAAQGCRGAERTTRCTRTLRPSGRATAPVRPVLPVAKLRCDRAPGRQRAGRRPVDAHSGPRRRVRRAFMAVTLRGYQRRGSSRHAMGRCARDHARRLCVGIAKGADDADIPDVGICPQAVEKPFLPPRPMERRRGARPSSERGRTVGHRGAAVLAGQGSPSTSRRLSIPTHPARPRARHAPQRSAPAATASSARDRLRCRSRTEGHPRSGHDGRRPDPPERDRASRACRTGLNTRLH